MTPPAAPVPGMIVLAGGLGSRLQGSIGPDLPKVLAPIHGRPFIDYLLAWLQGQQVPHVRFALGHRAAPVIAHLRQVSGDLAIAVDWCVEDSPLGTAGALAMALADRGPAPDRCLVMNGDTLVDADLAGFCSAFEQCDTQIGLVAATVPAAARFGALKLDDAGRILRFSEKGITGRAEGEAWINAGIYLMTPEIAERVRQLARGSLERDLLAALPAGTIWAFRGARHFIDIGTRESLLAAQRVLAPLAERAHAGTIWRSGAPAS